MNTEETSKITENFIQQLKSSGYARKQSREIVVAVEEEYPEEEE